jgi:hypothetical protein
MMSLLSRAAALVLILSLWSGAAEAKVGDGAWAECVWTQAPASAAKWLMMPTPQWVTPFTEPNVLLGHKLAALCDSTSVDSKRPNRMPNWKTLAAALRKAQPKTPSAAGTEGSAVALCQSQAEQEGETFIYLYEIVRRSAAGESVAFQQYFANVDGQTAKLPQDLRVVPPEGTEVERSCRLIGAEGELTDA